ncbi:hypothetical protein BJ165DRAFT_1522476 [Panaeolus papilionaceus]|nr:hypothetical protein BJ165DRAFT_1522476 [Panaeolus papilionaceus]
MPNNLKAVFQTSTHPFQPGQRCFTSTKVTCELSRVVSLHSTRSGISDVENVFASFAAGPLPCKKRKICEQHEETPNSLSFELATQSRSDVAKYDDQVTLECKQLVDYIDLLKLYLTFSNGSDHSKDQVTINDDFTLSELHRAQESVLNILETISSSHLHRGKILCKMNKYPLVNEFRTEKAALEEYDRHRNYLRRRQLCDIRNIYIALFELFSDTLCDPVTKAE